MSFLIGIYFTGKSWNFENILLIVDDSMCLWTRGLLQPCDWTDVPSSTCDHFAGVISHQGCNISGRLVQSPAAGFCLYKSNWRLSLNGEPPWTADSTCHCLPSCDRS
uniref:Uncharacterized protein n=1 Tax=Timema tahoe TaxID=61484 RepID=A0A7R9IFQ0_9NEOP|nr:unnamed protein product [Timema tahoe]